MSHYSWPGKDGLVQGLRYLSAFHRWRYIMIGMCLFVQACATPVGNLAQLAQRNGLERNDVRAEGFDLLVYENKTVKSAYKVENQDHERVLRVYLEGDGSPWKYRVFVMADPTPRNPLMLRLISYDSNPAVYLGRPCYNSSSNDPGCDVSLWTSGRYSDTVVQSMASAIRALSNRYNATQLWLMGHSGGGTLAMLLASELPQVTRIVTLAANLDTDGWTSHHRYIPLYSSINPATAPRLRPAVWQWHLVGGRDTVIPVQLIKPVIMAQSSASGLEFPGFSHGCCWERIWPEVLQALALDKPSRIRNGVQFKFKGESGESQ